MREAGEMLCLTFSDRDREQSAFSMPIVGSNFKHNVDDLDESTSAATAVPAGLEL